MKIGVTGATGQLGRLVIEKLKTKVPASDIVALARTPEKAKDVGVNTRKFDYNQADQLANSLKGIDRLLLISSNEIGQRLRHHLNVIEAAKKSGVKWIVYTSLLHADTSSLNLANEHLETENALKASGIPYTILRNGWYTENYTASVKTAVQGGAFLGSAGQGKISSASRLDYAEAAVNVILGDVQNGKIYELAGDNAYTLTDLAEEISKQSGNNIPYKDLPENKYAETLKSFGLPAAFASSVASWDVGASKGDLFDDSHELSKLIGRPTTPMAQSVKEALASNK